SKVMPSNASGTRLMQSLDRSLSHLGTDYLDLYLYHWRGERPLAEMVAAMEGARAAGKIRAWGVSNLDTADMEELWRIDGGRNCAANQVLYHMGSRGIDYSLLPWMRAHRVALMAYCPLAQVGRLGCDLLGSRVIAEIAAKYGATPAQVALAWAIRDGNTIAIPRTGRKEHAVSNAGADALDLTAEDCAVIDRAFPPPTRKEPLHIE
ncbi:MAG: aldo/keto reductase, partial [Selenomonas massiliensis]